MFVDSGFCLAKQGCHLVLGKPNGFFLQSHIYPNVTIGVLVYDEFTVHIALSNCASWNFNK
ncbi:MAG: hypothetical protein ACK56V_07225 [Bacteroidota bacterium]